MTTAEELLRSITSQPNPEGHIVVGGDRFVKVPNNLKRLAVQYDHNMETVTFDCPRYWDDRDMSKMAVYINYMLSNGYTDRYPADNVREDGDVMHFDWTITRNVSQVAGSVSFLVCVMKTDADGNEERHWNSELYSECYVSQGMETEEHPALDYPDEVTQLLLRMATVEQINVQAEEMQALYDATVEVANTAEETKNQALDASGYIRNAYANAIKDTVSGEVIRVDDVSPIEHDVKCLVRGKNLFDISKLVTLEPSVSYAYVSEVGEDYLIVTTETGYDGNGYCTVPVKLRDVCPRLQLGKTYILTAETESNSTNVYLPGIQKSWVFGTAKVITEDMLNSTLTFYGLSAREGMGTGDCRIFNIQIEEGSIATEYESYVDPTTVAISRSGKNLWHSRGITYPRTVSGVTINYDEETQIYTFNGTSTSPGDIYVIPNQSDIMHINAGETWTLRVYPMGGTIDGAATCSGKMSPLVNTGDYANTIHANTESLYVTKTYTESADIKKMYFYVYDSGIVFNNFRCRVQLELSDGPSEFEKSSGIATSIPSSDGTCVVTSKSPTMTLFTDTPGVIIEAEYNVDTKTYVKQNSGAVSDEQIENAVDKYLEENPIDTPDADLTDYVKKTDYPNGDTGKAGVVKVNPTEYGVGAYPTNGHLYIVGASESTIAAKQHYRQPIMPNRLDYAVKVGLTTNTITLTDDEKAAAQNWLGLGSIETAKDAVLYTAQELTEEQKEQARQNIGAAAVGEGGNGAGIDDTVVSKDSTWSSEKIASEVSNTSGGTAADVTQFYRIFPAMDYKITFVVDSSNNVTITLPSILYIEKATAYVTRINVDASANTFTLASTRMLCYSISGGTFAVYTEGQYAAAKTDLVPCAFNHYGRIKGQWEVYSDYLSKADFRTDYNIKMCAILMGYEEEGYSVTGFQRYIDFTFDDAGNKYTMTIPKGTTFVYGNEGKKLHTVAAETSINLGTVSQHDKLVWFNTSTNEFRVTASTSSPYAAEVLVCALKTEVGSRGCISVSILAPYTINGFLPGMESVYNTIDNVKYLLDFVYGDIRNATDTLQYAQTKRMAMKAPKCLPYDITVMQSNVYHYLYTYDDANGTNGKSYGIINQTGNYTIKAGTYFRLTAHAITNEVGVLGDRYNNPVFNEIRIYRTDMLKEKFEVAFTPYERYMNTNIRAISHRGLNRVAPENTLPAYIEARKAGFEYAETDVAFTADGHAVLLHDTTVDRTSDGTGNIADLTLEQVRALDFGSWFSPAYAGTQIPTFEEFISLCRKIGLKPYVELRDMTTEQAQSLVTIVKKYGMQKNTTWICTSTTTLSAISTAYPAARLGLVCSGLTEANVASAVALRNEVNDVFIDTDDTSDNAVALMMAADIEGEVWTVWTEAVITGLNPYFTGVTSDNLVAGSVLYKSTIGEYE